MTEVRHRIADAVRRNGLGGVAVAVVRRGGAPNFECTGMADVASGRSIGPETVFRIASISKTMTAIGVLQLRDQSRFGLDDPVNRYLETFTVEAPAGAPEVTFRHLLTHTAGIGEGPTVADLFRRESWGMAAPRTQAADLAAIYRGTLRPEVAAGTKWAYANHGFAVLGQLVEDVAGQPFAEHMEQALFAPLGMTSTEYIHSDRTDANLATGHHWLGGRLRANKPYDLALLGPGSVLSSLHDMAVYAEWLLRGGDGAHGPVLATETLVEMMSPQYAVDPRLPPIGLAFWLDRIGGRPVAGHDGNVPGFSSALLVAPDAGVGVVVLANTGSAFGAHLLARELMTDALEPDAHAIATSIASSIAIDRPDVWPDLVGHYAPAPGFLTNLRSWQMLGGEIEVFVKHRRLFVRALSLLPVLRRGVELGAAVADDPLRFTATAEGLTVEVAFTRTNGAIERVAVGPPVNVMFHRRSPLRSARVRWRAAGAVVAFGAARRALRRRRARSS